MQTLLEFVFISINRTIVDAVILDADVRGIFVGTTLGQTIENARVYIRWWQADLTHLLSSQACEVVEGHLGANVAYKC